MSRDNPGSTERANLLRSKYAAARRNLAIELWDTTNMTVWEIAEFLGVSGQTVSRYLR